jgi:ribose transport system substrate-binding protein
MTVKAPMFIMTGVLTALMLAGCSHSHSSSGGSSATSGAASSGDKIQIGFVTNSASDFWTIARKGTEKAESELPNVSVQFVIPGDGTLATQKSDVDDLLAKGVKGIAISPVEPKDQTQMLNDVASQAALITQDSDAPDSNRLCYIGTDNHGAGLQVGQLLKEALPQGGKIMLFVGNRDAQNAQEREAGVREAIKGTNIQILDVRTDGTDIAKAKSNVSDAIVKYPDLAGCVGLWGYNGPAILSALKDAGKVGKIKIVCFDEQDETLAGVKDGSIYATVVQQPYEFGYKAVKLLAQVIAGDKSGIPAGKQEFIPTKEIKQADVDAFKAQLDKLRGRA